MELSIETVSTVALGIGLSASTGFRVFIPLFVAVPLVIVTFSCCA